MCSLISVLEQQGGGLLQIQPFDWTLQTNQGLVSGSIQMQPSISNADTSNADTSNADTTNADTSNAELVKYIAVMKVYERNSRLSCWES